MRIHSLTLDNVRAIEHLELRDLPDTGVIVVHGRNEAGKSTILDALDAVLNERHSGAGKKVRALAPAGRDESPEVELNATIGETTFTVRKRWLKGKKSELTVHAPLRANFTGREADDELLRILDEHLDTALAETLFLRQGDLDPAIAAAGIPTISRALDAEAGEGETGEEDSDLARAIDAENGKYWTNAQPPKKKAPYVALFTAVEDAREKLRTHEAEVQQLSQYVDEVERRKSEIDSIDKELPDAEQELREREQASAAANQVRDKAATAQERLERATITRKRAEQDVADRNALKKRVELVKHEEAQLREEIEPARKARNEEGEKIATLLADVEGAKTRLTDARTASKHAETLRDLARAKRRLKTIDEQLERIGTVEQAYKELLSNAPERDVTDKHIRDLEQAENEVTLQRRLRDASSAKLEITADNATITVDGDDRPINGTETVAVFEGSTLQLGEFGVVFRAAQGSADPQSAVEKAERAFADALAATGCDSVDEARAARDATQEYASELKVARQRLDDTLAGASADELRAERTKLSAQAEELAAALKDTAASDVVAEVDEADAEEALRETQKALANAERDVDAAEAALKPYVDKTAAHTLTVLETRLEAKTAEASAAAAELSRAEETTRAEDLDKTLQQACEDETESQQVVDALKAELAEADPEFAASLLEGATTRLSNLEKRKNDAQNRIRELTGYIDMATGTAEQADHAAAELEIAQAALDRATRRAEAVKLLRETMHRHRDVARSRYAAPFNAAVRERARILFGPSVDFNYGDDLTITDRTVDGVTVPLDQLSGGTKEQLAILTRFAIADLVSGEGTGAPVPVVVDDALGATDPERLARMNSLFSQVGKHSQVLVLTCFPQRFDRVSAARTYAVDDLKGIHKGIG
ncbi:hypothetical protein CYJ46_07825 [Corynebacterium coyleae]|uniref:AAA family ATPase n=1 Tax=Corynebacterium coyleae TaxID=53374 RepID=UPI000C770786|nr:AAA family ATPase [Corynebacterium coyleae]PLA37613.1 hypothetical protein CYJ46_07825 [Corynebacterium coyleae]